MVIKKKMITMIRMIRMIRMMTVPIVVTLVGIIIDVIPKHHEKAYSPNNN